MSINRREMLGGVAAAAAAGLAGLPVPARAITPGKPFAGKEIKVLAVQSTQFTAHAKKVAAFAEQTGIKVTYVYRALRRTSGAPDRRDGRWLRRFRSRDGDGRLDPAARRQVSGADRQGSRRAEDRPQTVSALRSWHREFTRPESTAFRCAATFNFCGIARTCSRKPDSSLPRPGTRWSRPARRSRSQNPGIAGVTIPYGKADGQNLMVWYNFLWGAGGDLFDAEHEADLQQPGRREGDPGLHGHHPQAQDHAGRRGFLQRSGFDDLFLPGQGRDGARLVARLQPSQACPDAGVKAEQVGFVPLPSYPGKGSTTYTNDWIYGLNAKSKNRDAARWSSSTTSAQPDIETFDPDRSQREATSSRVHWSNLRDPGGQCPVQRHARRSPPRRSRRRRRRFRTFRSSCRSSMCSRLPCPIS